MTLMIAGDRSGVGKTTITLALLSYLCQKGAKVQSFKVGPDYIDPMFHTYITGRPCRNLDPILTSETYVKTCFQQHRQSSNYALIEGVMGLFDGVPINKATAAETFPPYGSTAHLARLLNIPVVLVIDCSRLSGSVAAIAHGYRSLDPNLTISGVILNRVGSDRHLAMLKNALNALNIPILGTLRRQASLSIPDRHLGLIPTAELSELNRLVDQLAHLAQTCFNWERLLPLLQSEAKPITSTSVTPNIPRTPLKIAIARDRAFNFYYPDNLDILEQSGAELIFWSPLKDETLPQEATGLYFGGGFPEIFAEALSNNHKALATVKTAISQGMPTYAECGGLMYLCQAITTFEETTWPMVGLLPTTARMTNHLTLGYRQAIASQNRFLLTSNQHLWGHEFHRSELTRLSPQPLFNLASWHADSPTYAEGWGSDNLHASYLHLHFGGCPTIAQNFLRRCLAFFELLALD